jgi:tRNA A37 threonylcarbamoyladenosine modification protein TsaB
MNVLAIQSSGNETSLCVILGDDVLEYSISHDRKDRPNWQEMLSQIGLDSFFSMADIDIFAYANNEDSYTATRSVASYLKGISSALKKPLITIDANKINTISSNLVAKNAIQKFKDSGMQSDLFDSKDANPTYALETKYKKINE